MVRLLMDLVHIECRIAGLAMGAGLDAEFRQAIVRAEYYLRLRASERNRPSRTAAERRRRFRAWLRDAT